MQIARVDELLRGRTVIGNKVIIALRETGYKAVIQTRYDYSDFRVISSLRAETRPR